MPFSLLIATEDRTDILQHNSLHIGNAIGGRSNCTFQLKDQSGAFRTAVGREVLIKDFNGSVIFGGSIDRLVEIAEAGTIGLQSRSPIMTWDVTCVDQNALADRHFVKRVYEANTAMGDVVQDIINRDMAQEFITTGNLNSGPVLTKRIVFNYDKVSEAFGKIAESAGKETGLKYVWWIDATRDLHFHETGFEAAPFNISDAVLPAENFDTISVETSRDQYRNRQFVRAGLAIAPTLTETFTGDGNIREFITSVEIGAAPVITLGGVEQTVGIFGVDTGRNWYWLEGSKAIIQDPGDAPIDSTPNSLSVSYVALFSNVVSAEDAGQITDRQLLEGQSGVYEAIIDDSGAVDVDTATRTAESLIERYGTPGIPKTVVVGTRTPGLSPGQVITIGLVIHAIDPPAPYLIERVDISDVAGGFLRYSAVCRSGTALGDWIQFFENAFATGGGGGTVGAVADTESAGATISGEAVTY